jgi:hypothetical protein
MLHRHRERDELLQDAVMERTLDPAAFCIGREDESLAGSAECGNVAKELAR